MFPFIAAYYSRERRKQLAELIAPDLDSPEMIWGGRPSIRAFRNVLVGTPEQRGEVWQAWITSGDIELADEQAFYILRQQGQLEGEKIDRWAVFCELDINDPKLFIHEDVVPEGVERARQATEACEADVAPIFVGYNEGIIGKLRTFLADVVGSRTPLLNTSEEGGATHEVWSVPEESSILAIQKLLEDASLYLLDGHHRLAAAKSNYRAGIGDGKILACLCSMGMPDTLILPIHRLVHSSRWMLPNVLNMDLEKAGCRVSELSGVKAAGIKKFLEEADEKGPHCVALHSHSKRPILLRLPEGKGLAKELRKLSVACLDTEVLMQFPEANSIPVTSIDQALAQLAADQAQVGFFLPAASARQVQAVAAARLMMPRKSTRFMPKPVLGLISRPWMASG